MIRKYRKNPTSDSATMLPLDFGIFGSAGFGRKKYRKKIIMNNKIFLDNGGRRSGTDRRRFSYAEHIPERRSSIDRRKGLERRGDRRKYTEQILEREQQQEQTV